MYADRPRLFLGIGLLFVPLGLVTTGVQYLLFRHGTFSQLVASAGASNAVVAALALAVGFFFTLLGLTVVHAATAAAIVELDRGREVGARAAYRLALAKLRPTLVALVRAALVIALLSLTAFGALLGIWLAIRWSLLAQVAILEDNPSPGLLRRSARLVRGHWWRAASITLFVSGIGLLLGPLIGTLFLFATSASFDFVNLVSGLVYVVALPFVAITTTYLYFDLAVRDHLAAHEAADANILPAEL